MKLMKNNDYISNTLSIEVLYECFYKVKKTCKNKRKIFDFETNLNSNIIKIYLDIKNNCYVPSSYNAFCIYEPKPRIVMSQEIRDKIINHYLTNYILVPILENKLIDQNVATRKNKGTKEGIKYAFKYINILNSKYEKIYCLKLDINKYFYNIDLNILYDKLYKDIKDERLISLIKTVLSRTYEYSVNKVIKRFNYMNNQNVPLYTIDRGLSIGAVICQFLAIYNLNDIDHYVKEKLKCKYYIRYMDDMLIFSHDKDELKQVWNNVEIELNKINLKLNKKSNIYNLCNGINFLGINFKVRNKKLIINPYKKTLKKIKLNLYKTKKHDILKFYRVIGSYHGYLGKFKNLERIVRYTMTNIEKYQKLKEKYNSSIIILRDKEFFDCFGNDAKILHYLTSYKLVNIDGIERCGFGRQAYSKVIDKIVNSSLSYIIVDNDIKLIDGFGDNYSKTLELAENYIEKENEIRTAQHLLQNIIKINYKSLKDVIKYLSELNNTKVITIDNKTSES